MRILFAGGGTGGHLYPGLAIARALVRLEPGVKPFFIGAQRGIERDVLPTTEFEHELLDLHPLYRRRPWRNWYTVTGAARSWRRLSGILKRLEPTVLLGTGGYAAGLALAAARSARIPYALQEQNSFPGLTQRFFSKGAREIYLGFPEAGQYLKRGRGTSVIDTGNPIEPPPAERLDREAALKQWDFPGNAQRVLLVVGGSQGAKPINSAVAAAINTLNSGGTYVIWATGTAHFDEFQRLNSEKTRVVAYLSPIAKAYAVADFVVCRAGAITTAELCAWGIPSLLIPLPTAAADHQNANARALEAAGCAVVMSQSELSAERLAAQLRRIFSDESSLEKMRAAARLRGRPQAAEDIAARLLEMSHVK